VKSRQHITRFTYANSAFRGWRLAYTRAGKSFVKYFSDRRYGGARKALDEAQVLLSDLKSILEPIPPQTSLRRMDGENVPGVYRGHLSGRGGTPSSPAWIATWTAEGKRHTRKFSVAKYGEAKAKANAIKARRDGEREEGKAMSRKEIRTRLERATATLAKVGA